MDYLLLMGLVVNLVVDGVDYIVLMVIEEFFVIVVVSNGVKIVKCVGGFMIVFN